MLSQATLSKIPELEVVTSEVVRTLQPGGLAILGLGGTKKCDGNFYLCYLQKRDSYFVEEFPLMDLLLQSQWL